MPQACSIGGLAPATGYEEVNAEFLHKRMAALKQLEEFVIGGIDDRHDELRHEFRVLPGPQKPLDPGPLKEGVFGRERLAELDDMQWMIRTWPKLKFFKLGVGVK